MPTSSSSPTVSSASLSPWEPRELASSAFAEGQLLPSLPHPLEQQAVMYRVGWDQGQEDGGTDGLHMGLGS